MTNRSGDLLLAGKRIIVTGAAHGLGRSYALHAAAAGAAVVVNDVDGDGAAATADAITVAGGTAVPSAHSVTESTQVEDMVGLCTGTFGGIDGLVNNAGVYHEALPWEEDPRRLRAIVEVNVLGSMLCGSVASREMRQQGHGRIVNVSSGAALGIPRTAAYAATKGAIVSLTRTWAMDLQDAAIDVNCISPMARTNMTSNSPLTRSIVGDEMTPDRIAPLVTFLLSDRAAGITGQFIRFNGEQLHLVTPLKFAEPVIDRPTWDVDSIADAFDGSLRTALQPLRR